MTELTMRGQGTGGARRAGARVLLFLLYGFLAATDAFACPVCYSASDPVVTGSLNAGIFVLLGITTLVLAGFARFIASLVRRARSVQLIGDPLT